MDLQRLADRAAISDTVIQYATGIDMLRWDLYRDAFTDPLLIDFSSFNGVAERTSAREDWVKGVASLQEGFDATQHISSNHVITFDGADRAICVSYMQATHYIRPEAWVLGGYYTNTLVRTEAGWKITRCQLDVTWETGSRALAEQARARVAAGQGRAPRAV